MVDARDPLHDTRTYRPDNTNRDAFKMRKVDRKPESAPRSRKHFREVMEGEEEGKESTLAKPAADASKGSAPAPSLFDLSAASGKSEDTGAVKKASADALTRNAFAEEQPDLSAVNPAAAEAGVRAAATDAVVGERPAAAVGRTELQEIVDQIVGKLYMLKAESRTDTTLTLKHPPLFAGVTVTVSNYETARGEVNISFANLTQQAKEMLDLGQNGLKQVLEGRGVIVHMITTSAEAESPLATEAEGQADEQRDDQQREQQQEERGDDA